MAFPTSTSVTGQREDEFTSRIESQTSRIPSSGYLGAALGSMAGSAVLKMMGKDNWAEDTSNVPPRCASGTP